MIDSIWVAIDFFVRLVIAHLLVQVRCLYDHFEKFSHVKNRNFGPFWAINGLADLAQKLIRARCRQGAYVQKVWFM